MRQAYAPSQFIKSFPNMGFTAIPRFDDWTNIIICSSQEFTYIRSMNSNMTKYRVIVSVTLGLFLMTGCNTHRAANVLNAAAIVVQSADSMRANAAARKRKQRYDEHRPNILCQRGHMENSACLPPAASPTTTPPASGSVKKQKLRSCKNSDIAAQIESITRQGESLKRGAGAKRLNTITVQVMDASIDIYQQVMNSCNVDKSAYQSAINQLEGTRRTAQSNIKRL